MSFSAKTTVIDGCKCTVIKMAGSETLKIEGYPGTVGEFIEKHTAELESLL